MPRQEITSGRRPQRPDGAYYRETRRRRLADRGRAMMRPRAWWAVTFTVIIVVLVITWMLR